MTSALYVDVEGALVAWLPSQVGGVRVVTELPAVLPDPVIQVQRFGGGRQLFPYDQANVDIDVYATSRKAAHDLSEQVCMAFQRQLAGTVIDGAIFLSAECTSAPKWVPYDNTNVRRLNATYFVRTHNPI